MLDGTATIANINLDNLYYIKYNIYLTIQEKECH